MNPVKAQCKRCGNFVPSDQFRLHFEYRQMVCPGCFKGKAVAKDEKPKKVEPPRPPGWDADDDYLEKMSRLKKQEQNVQFKKIPGTDQVQCTCMKCKYQFKYDPFRKRPRVCPYCSEEIPQMKTFSML